MTASPPVTAACSSNRPRRSSASTVQRTWMRGCSAFPTGWPGVSMPPAISPTSSAIASSRNWPGCSPSGVPCRSSGSAYTSSHSAWATRKSGTGWTSGAGRTTPRSRTWIYPGAARNTAAPSEPFRTTSRRATSTRSTSRRNICSTSRATRSRSMRPCGAGSWLPMAH